MWKYAIIIALKIIGISYISTLIFAVISDAKLGRAKTILIGNVWLKLLYSVLFKTAFFDSGFAFYLIGFAMFTITVSGKTSFCLFNGILNKTGTGIAQEKCASSILGTLIPM